MATDPPPKTAFIYPSFANVPRDELKITLCPDYPASKDVLALTKPYTQGPCIGRVLYAPQVYLWDQGKQAIFHTSFTFKISPKGNSFPSDGIAFFIADPTTDFPARGYAGSLGIFDPNGNNPKVFAVEFATDGNNSQEPHVGIDITRRDSKPIRIQGNFYDKEVTATIIYRKSTITIVVITDQKNATAVEVSKTVDFTYLPKYVQVGISASSGNNTENHYVYEWSFTSALVNEAPDV